MRRKKSKAQQPQNEDSTTTLDGNQFGTLVSERHTSTVSRGVNSESRVFRNRNQELTEEQVDHQAEQQNVAAHIDELLNEEQKIEPLFNRKSRRVTIGWIFENVFGGIKSSIDTPWKGVDGIMPKIKKMLGIHKKTDISSILYGVLDSKRLGLAYTGERVIDLNEKIGRPPIIQVNSMEAQIIVDYIEDGGSILNAHLLVNEHRRQQNLSSLTIAATKSLINRALAKLVKVQSLKQGSNDPNSAWAIALYRWVCHLLVQLGLLFFIVHGQEERNRTTMTLTNLHQFVMMELQAGTKSIER